MFINNTLDNFFNEVSELTLIYGPSTSGKSTLAMQSALEFAKKGRVLFLDTEKSFSVDRIKLMNKDYKKLLNNILVITIKDFEDQCMKLDKIEELVEKGKFGYVVIDSFGVFYRHALHNDNYIKVNEKIIPLLRNLKHVVERGVPVLLTNQVYDSQDGGIKTVGGNMLRNFSTAIYELLNEPRRAKMHKPIEKDIEFQITNLGFLGL